MSGSKRRTSRADIGMANMAPAGSGLLTELRSSIRKLSQLAQEQSEKIARVESDCTSAKRDAELASAQFADLKKGMSGKVEAVVSGLLTETVQRHLKSKVCAT